LNKKQTNTAPCTVGEIGLNWVEVTGDYTRCYWYKYWIKRVGNQEISIKIYQPRNFFYRDDEPVEIDIGCCDPAYVEEVKVLVSKLACQYKIKEIRVYEKIFFSLKQFIDKWRIES